MHTFNIFELEFLHKQIILQFVQKPSKELEHWGERVCWENRHLGTKCRAFTLFALKVQLLVLFQFQSQGFLCLASALA